MPYQVQIEKFQGPLDLLLQLIEEQKLAITEISLAQVTQQFLDYLKGLTHVEPEILADFLIVASKLIVIKSKSLLPLLEEEAEEQEAGDLTYQLIEFKKFKEVAKFLEGLEVKKRFSFIREGSTKDRVAFYPDKTVSVKRLYQAIQSLARNLEEIIKLPSQVVKEVLSISEKIKQLQQRLAEKIEMKLSEAFNRESKTDIIVTFLALLELTKQRLLSVEQETAFADIKIKKITDKTT